MWIFHVPLCHQDIQEFRIWAYKAIFIVHLSTSICRKLHGFSFDMKAIRPWDWVILFFVGCTEIWNLAWMAPIYKSVLVNSAIAIGASCWSSVLGLACLPLLAVLTHSELTSRWTLWVHEDVVVWNRFPHYGTFVRKTHKSSVGSPHKDK